MPKRRADLGFDLVHADAAIAAFIDRIIRDDDPSNRDRLYSVGLNPDLIYSLKKGRQRKLAGGKLVAALAACPDLEVVIEGRAIGNSPPPRWIVRGTPDPNQSAPPPRDTSNSDSASDEPGVHEPIQLSLFSSLEAFAPLELEMRDVQFTRKGSGRADIRVDLVLKRRQAS